jgi:hypothetical protein
MTLFDVADLGSESAPGERPAMALLAEPSAPAPTWPRPNAGTVDAVPQAEPVPEVEVRISTRRKKTSEAKWVGGRIVVSLPAHLDVESRQKTTDWLVNRLLTRHGPQSALADDDLLARAIALSERYLVGARPASVRWVTNQSARWGSCSYYSGHIRISHRLRVVPDWVLDSVLVHEVAHLTHADHSPAFHRLAGAFPRHEEAGVFLAGYGLGLSNPAP